MVFIWPFKATEGCDAEWGLNDTFAPLANKNEQPELSDYVYITTLPISEPDDSLFTAVDTTTPGFTNGYRCATTAVLEVLYDACLIAERRLITCMQGVL